MPLSVIIKVKGKCKKETKTKQTNKKETEHKACNACADFNFNLSPFFVHSWQPDISTGFITDHYGVSGITKEKNRSVSYFVRRKLSGIYK